MKTAAVTLLAIFLALPAYGSVARAVSFDEKVDRAEAIVLGRCTGTRSAFDAERRFIYTTATFTVEKSLKGSPRQTIEVTLPGGSVDGIHQTTIGTPSFREGDERVLFLNQTPIGQSVLYFDQGNYEITREGGRRIVSRAASDLILVDTQSGKVVPDEVTRPLEVFEREVASSIDRGRRARMQQAAVSESQTGLRSFGRSVGDFASRHRLLLLLAAAGALLSLLPLLKRR